MRRVVRLLAALLTLPVFVAVAMVYTLVALGTWIIDGE